MDATQKLTQFFQAHLKPSKIKKQTRLRIQHTTLEKSPYIRQRNLEQYKSRITAAEANFFRQTAENILLGHKKSKIFWSKFKLNQFWKKKINHYKNKWIQHVRRMGRFILSRTTVTHQLAGKWNPERSLNIFLECNTGRFCFTRFLFARCRFIAIWNFTLFFKFTL